MAENLYPPIVVNVTSGANAATGINGTGLDSEISIRTISAIANVADEIIYYKTGTIIYSTLENCYYKYSGTAWEEYPYLPTTGVGLSAGCVVHPGFTDNNNGSATIDNTGIFNLFSDPDGNSLILQYPINGGVFTFTDGMTNYIVANYNNGNPVLQLTTDVTIINETTIIPIFTVYRGGTRLHRVDWDNLALALANKLHQSIVKTQRYRLQSGLSLGETGTRNVTVSSGIVWMGANAWNLGAFDSTTDNIFFLYHVGGVWQSPSIVHTYNNTQYDDGTQLQSVNPNKYVVNYIYRGIEVENECYMVLGGGNYTLLEAQGSLPPNNLPPIITSHAILVGRIIVERNKNTAYQIDSIFSAAFALSTTIDHNDLTDLQGGTAGEYYHLTSAQVDRVNGKHPLVTVTGNTTLDITHEVVLCNGTLTISLPLASTVTGRTYRIKNIGFGLVTISATLIDGQANQYLSTRYSSIDVISDGSSWYIL